MLWRGLLSSEMYKIIGVCGFSVEGGWDGEKASGAQCLSSSCASFSKPLCIPCVHCALCCALYFSLICACAHWTHTYTHQYTQCILYNASLPIAPSQSHSLSAHYIYAVQCTKAPTQMCTQWTITSPCICSWEPVTTSKPTIAHASLPYSHVCTMWNLCAQCKYVQIRLHTSQRGNQTDNASLSLETAEFPLALPASGVETKPYNSSQNLTRKHERIQGSFTAMC